VTSGPWAAYVERVPDQDGQLIVALGRTAGTATVRSRARRIAREVYASRFGRPGEMSLLLLARGAVGGETRGQLRGRLAEMLGRAAKLVEGRNRIDPGQ
jgi:RNase P protein component